MATSPLVAGGYGAGDTSGSSGSAAQQLPRLKLDCDPILEQFRAAFTQHHKAKHGHDDATAIWRLRRTFLHDFDADRNGVVDMGEFVAAIHQLGMGLSQRDAQMLFLAFDRNSDGTLRPCEFVDAVRGGESTARRRRLLEEAYGKLDKSGDGELTIDDLRLHYGADAKDWVLENMIKELKGRGSGGDPRKAVVSKDEFFDHYDDLTCRMTEAQFEHLVS